MESPFYSATEHFQRKRCDELEHGIAINSQCRVNQYPVIEGLARSPSLNSSPYGDTVAVKSGSDSCFRIR
ncbi:uncharacterized protein PHALS_07828 [Plasmopara halstedii]|uniref:Uncharacterized protein n=1 Tax=Plasmopara halstedii TaxID=4781 RepID=A0A0P1B5J5_PLAHL|nr:uncharacterized protein PHALS_07828 [Plasmopara halstedii]CEG50102.1 hypothetical protein PHALS_07828 [Plasmopara halstedii]|eukprot:XP_024586471.1 hypothetical protein PHALS_07828 [Plasmopara halstedii]